MHIMGFPNPTSYPQFFTIVMAHRYYLRVACMPSTTSVAGMVSQHGQHQRSTLACLQRSKKKKACRPAWSGRPALRVSVASQEPPGLLVTEPVCEQNMCLTDA